jgi:uncharacterized protein
MSADAAAMPSSLQADWLVHESLQPNTSGSLSPLYEAALRGELRMPFCGTCRGALDLDQLRCQTCAATTPTWQRVDPIGEVHAVTMVHRRERGLILTDEPYPVIDVELRSGHRLIITTDAPLTTAPTIGEAVVVAFRLVGNVAVPSVSTAELHHQSPQHFLETS